MGLPAGVPALLFGQVVSFIDPTGILTADTFIGYGFGEPPLWGVFLNGVPVVIADTVTDLGYNQDWAVADYPVERGGFESYDKVNLPYRIRVQFVSGGSEGNRQALLDSVAAIADQLTLYDVITPEAVYIGVNVEHYDYRRAARNGIGLMIIDVHLLEIREDGVSNFQNTASPASFQASPAGNVQSQSTTQAVPQVT